MFAYHFPDACERMAGIVGGIQRWDLKTWVKRDVEKSGGWIYWFDGVEKYSNAGRLGLTSEKIGIIRGINPVCTSTSQYIDIGAGLRFA